MTERGTCIIEPNLIDILRENLEEVFVDIRKEGIALVIPHPDLEGSGYIQERYLYRWNNEKIRINPITNDLILSGNPIRLLDDIPFMITTEKRRCRLGESTSTILVRLSEDAILKCKNHLEKGRGTAK